MKKYLIVLIIVFLSQNKFAAAQNTPLNFYKNQLKISPFRLIDPFNSGTELSFERATSNKSSLQFSASYLKDVLKVSNRVLYDGYRISTEKKFFIFNFVNTRPYAAAEFVFASFKYSDEINWRRGTYIDKQTSALNLKIGSQFYIDRFVIDMCLGLGAKYKQVKYKSNVKLNKNPDYSWGSGYFSPDIDEKGNYWVPSTPINIKVGYCFGKKFSYVKK